LLIISSYNLAVRGNISTGMRAGDLVKGVGRKYSGGEGTNEKKDRKLAKSTEK